MNNQNCDYILKSNLPIGVQNMTLKSIDLDVVCYQISREKCEPEFEL